MKRLKTFWRDERGCLPAMEWVFVASILTLGAIAGLLALQHAGELPTLSRVRRPGRAERTALSAEAGHALI